MSEERKKIVGVNLGNWLVLEKWMQPFLFEENCAEDEAVSYTHLTLPTSDLV